MRDCATNSLCHSYAVNGTLLSFIHAVGICNTFLFYAGMSVIALWFVYTYIPETAGMSLEAIQEHFRLELSIGNIPLFSCCWGSDKSSI